jgi:hypothetical protein
MHQHTELVVTCETLEEHDLRAAIGEALDVPSLILKLPKRMPVG